MSKTSAPASAPGDPDKLIDPDPQGRGGNGIAAWAEVFGVLSDENRLRLLLRIHAAGRICVSDLADETERSATAVSQALRLLRTAGFVSSEREGRQIYYSLAHPLIHELLHRLTGTRSHQLTSHPH